MALPAIVENTQISYMVLARWKVLTKLLSRMMPSLLLSTYLEDSFASDGHNKERAKKDRRCRCE